MSAVLDASAVLTWLQGEPGSDRVAPLLDGAIVTAANWSELLQKAGQHGSSIDEVSALLRALGVQVVDVTAADGEWAASIWSTERPLSLADRLCLAVAARLELSVVTADRHWAKLDLDLEVQLIR